MKPLVCVSLFLLVCYVVVAEMGMDDHTIRPVNPPTKDHCAIGRDCTDCTRRGCNFCARVKGDSFCTSANFTEADCATPGCSADTFYTSLASCSGGCSQQRNCGDCFKIEGCDWCHGSEFGPSCEEVSKRPATCKAWAGNSSLCSIPCEMRNGCEYCLSGQRDCLWCGEECKTRTLHPDPKVADMWESLCTANCDNTRGGIPNPHPPIPSHPTPRHSVSPTPAASTNVTTTTPVWMDISYIGFLLLAFVVVVSMAAIIRHVRKNSARAAAAEASDDSSEYTL